jgi:hypothetical protein
VPMSLQSEPVQVRTGTYADLPALRGLYRRSSLSNKGDREVLLANSQTLEFPGSGLAEGRTRVAVGADGTILGFITSVDPDPLTHSREHSRARLLSEMRCSPQ